MSRDKIMQPEEKFFNLSTNSKVFLVIWMLLVINGKNMQAKKQERGYKAVPMLDTIGYKVN